MRKSNWIAGAAFVFVVLAIALTFDPLGFFADDVQEPVEDEFGGGTLTSTGLRGSGQGRLPDADPARWEGDPVGRLVLGLGEATLEGRVTGEGEPLRFARVHPVLPPPHDGLAVRTRKDGSWEIAGLPDGRHEVRASAEGYVGRTTVAPDVAGSQTATVETIDLARRVAENNRIRVRVTDPFGRPLPGAKVLATTMPWDLHLSMGPEVAGMPAVQHRSGTTDETGTVELGPLPAEKYAVVAHAPGYVIAAVNDLVVSGGRTRSVGLALKEGVSVQGRVIDRDGGGVEGALVMGMAQPSFVSSMAVRSAADGTFVLDGLRKGPYLFIGWHDKLGQTTTRGEAPGSLQMNLEGTGRVRGKVVWEDGTPVTAGHVRPFQNGPFQYVYSMVTALSADGTFDLDLPKGTWILRVQSDDGHMSDATTASVTVGSTADVTIKLPKTGVVRGVVTDDEGRHVAGAEVFVMKGGFPETPSREQYARTDAEGHFEVPGLPLESVGLYVQHADYQDTKIDALPAAPDKAGEISVRLSQGASVVGRVVDAAGQPIAGEQVNLALTWFDLRSTFTGDDGRYGFDHVSPATYSMTTGPYENGARGLSRSGVAVGETGQVVIDFEVPAATGRLAGTVRLGGTPVAGAQVTLIDDRGPEQAVRTTTDEAGRYLAEGLQLGGVGVTARTARGQTGASRGRTEAGETPNEVDVEIGTAGVQARILDAEGEPVSGSWINVEDAEPGDGGTWSRVKANGNSDTDGHFQADGLQPGTYVLRVNRVEFAQYVSEPFRIADGEVKDLGDVRLRRGAVLQGIVRDDAGSPVEKVTVSLRDMQGREVFLFSMATTGSDGRYALHGVEPGRYGVRFEAKGHAPGEATVEIAAEGASADGTLTRGGAVRATVQGVDGTPIAGARIRLFDEQGREVTRTISLTNFDTGRRFTAGDGRTTLADLASGIYVVRCELEGWTPVGSAPRVRVEPGAVADLAITLEKAP